MTIPCVLVPALTVTEQIRYLADLSLAGRYVGSIVMLMYCCMMYKRSTE